MDSQTRNAFMYASIAAMGGFLFGLDAALISGTVDFITQEFSLNDMQLGTAALVKPKWDHCRMAECAVGAL